jgi:hypothetical protein
LPIVDLLELTQKLWSGELEVAGPPSPEHPGDEKAVNPFVLRGELVEIGEGTAAALRVKKPSKPPDQPTPTDDEAKASGSRNSMSIPAPPPPRLGDRPSQQCCALT